MYNVSMKLKLLFDCDDTLYDLSWPFRMSAERLLPKEKIDHLNLETLYNQYRAFGDEIFDLVQNDKITIFDSGVYRIEKLCQANGIPISHSGAKNFQKVYQEYQQNIFMSDTLKEFFEHTNAEIAVLTNGEYHHQYSKIKALKMDQYVESTSIFISGKIGYAKPDVRAFQSVMDQLHELSSDWYYVGDNYTIDMEGAKNAGMKTIHFNRHHKQEGPCSDYVVYNEEELVELFKALEK